MLRAQQHGLRIDAMAMRSPRWPLLAALTLLAAGLCAACGPVSLPLIGSSTDGSVSTASKPAIAVASSANTGSSANAAPTPATAAATTKAGPQPVAVKRGSITNVLSLDGLVSPQDQTPLTYQWKAIVSTLNVKAGQTVQRGDSLIDFDTGDIPKTLDDAKNRLQDSEVQLAQAQTRQQSAAQKAVFDQAQRNQA